MNFDIKVIDDSNISSLKELENEAALEGHGFVQATIEQWLSGENTFREKEEVLYGVFLSGKCIGIGGLNVDPYLQSPGTGRLRRVYISTKHRRKGIGLALLKKILKKATQYFKVVRLYTANPEAAAFYESGGFSRSTEPRESHRLTFPPPSPFPLITEATLKDLLDGVKPEFKAEDVAGRFEWLSRTVLKEFVLPKLGYFT